MHYLRLVEDVPFTARVMILSLAIMVSVNPSRALV